MAQITAPGGGSVEGIEDVPGLQDALDDKVGQAAVDAAVNGLMENPMSASGDIIFGKVGGSNVALYADGARATGGGVTTWGFSGPDAPLLGYVDGSAAGEARSNGALVGSVYVVDLQTIRPIGSFSIFTRDAFYRATSVKVEVSEDGSTWDEILPNQALASNPQNNVSLGGDVDARYVRLTALSGAGGGFWMLNYVWVHGADAGDPQRLAAPASGSFLRGQPSLAPDWRTYAQALGDIGAQPLDGDLTAIAALTTTAFGRGLLALADAAALAANHSHGGGGSGLLGHSYHVRGSDGQLHLGAPGTTPMDVDATNMAVTFTAPASGDVLVEMEAFWSSNDNAGSIYASLREGTTQLGDRTLVCGPNRSERRVSTQKLTGLSAGSHTIKAAISTNGNGNSIVLSGPSYGPVVMKVWEL